MDAKQLYAVNLAIEGHSCVITGQAGTGKTWTIKTIVGKLREQGKIVQVTATTGKSDNMMHQQ